MPRPEHVHTCRHGGPGHDEEPWEEHQWKCNSPYCNDIERVCVKHGGRPPREDD